MLQSAPLYAWVDGEVHNSINAALRKQLETQKNRVNSLWQLNEFFERLLAFWRKNLHVKLGSWGVT